VTRVQVVYAVLSKRFVAAHQRALQAAGEAEMGRDVELGRAAGLDEALEILHAYATSNEGPRFALLLPRGDEEARERAARAIGDLP
jgi:hypothetical protein